MKKIIVIILEAGLFLSIVANQSQALCSSCQQSTTSGLRKILTTTPEVTNKIQFDLKNLTASGSSTSASSLEELRLKLHERKATWKEETKEIKETVKARFSQLKVNRIKNLFKIMINKYSAAITRLEKLVSRIESRLTKIETNNANLDTTEIREEIKSSQEKITTAKEALVDAQEGLEIILNNETPMEDFVNIANLLKQIKTNLIEVHVQLVHIIGDIKGLRVGNSLMPSPIATESGEASQEGTEI